MADETTTEGQVPAVETPTSPATPETTPITPEPAPPESAPATPDETPEEPEEFDRDRALKLIAKLRGEEKRARDLDKRTADQAKRLADYERREREAADAQLSEQERLATQLKRAEAELQLERQQARDTINRLEVQAHASRLQIVDPEAAVKLLDWAQLEYSDDGTPQNVEEALQALVAAKPYLAKAASAAPAAPPATSAAQPQTSVGNGATRTADASQRVFTVAEISSYPFYRANREAIQVAMREGRIV